MHDGPTVSVVVPVRDDADHLWRCLRALAVQTRTPDEIIVVDNASSDDSARIARSAGARVVDCAEVGIPFAAAAGYDAAEGELILRLDADSLPTPTWVAGMVAALSDPRVDAVTAPALFHDGPARLRAPSAWAFLAVYTAFTFPALGHAPLWGSNMAFRRSAWEAVRDRVHRDPALHDDLDLAFHLGERHRIRILRGDHMRVSSRTVRPDRFVRSFSMGMRTVFAHWPGEVPPVRWLRRAVAERGGRGRRR